MEKIVLHASRRTITGKKVGVLRRMGKLPAVLYGHHIEPTPITLDLREASRALSGITSSTLVTINVDGKEHSTLVRDKQLDYILHSLLHVDFQVVSLTEKIRASVSIVHKGIAPAVKDFNGVVISGLDAIDVEALPQDLPESITLDISGLKEIGDGIYVRDLPHSEKITLLSDPEEMLITIAGAEKEEVAEVSAEEVALAEPEVIEKGKKEEEVEE